MAAEERPARSQAIVSDDESVPSPSSACRAAMLTPPGRGAIATVAVFGPDARRCVAACFRPAGNPPLEKRRPDRPAFGTWRRPRRDADTPTTGDEMRDVEASREANVVGANAASELAGEELIVRCDGSDYAEIHCHGGRAAVMRILDDLRAEGCEIVEPEAWVRHVEPDPLIADAQIELSKTLTARTAALLLDQYRGALKSAVQSIVDRLISSPSRTIDDDPGREKINEGVNAVEARELGDVTIARRMLADLCSRADLGLHLTTPWKVVLAGEPNVGKSSLMNRLCGFDRSIVFDQPGTTRDVLTFWTALDGWPIELSDTAGIRDASDELEAAGVARARRQLDDADLIVWVVDARSGASVSPALQSLSQLELSKFDCKRRPLCVANKSDLATTQQVSALPSDTIPTSATQGAGIDRLATAIVERLVPDPPEPGTPIPFLARHVEGLVAAVAALESNDLESARAAIFGLMGIHRPAD